MTLFLKTLIAILAINIFAPINFLLTFSAYPISLFLNFRKRKNRNQIKILITGGQMCKALLLCRLFYKNGYDIVLAETKNFWMCNSRFSNCINKFCLVPEIDNNPKNYINSIKRLIKTENIKIFIPVSKPNTSYYDALIGEEVRDICDVLHTSSKITKILDNKFSFAQLVSSLGFPVAKSFLITDIGQILNFDFKKNQSYILKNIKYNPIARLSIPLLPFNEMNEFFKNLNISQKNPWVLQEFVKGEEYCTHSLVKNGKIMLHCCSHSSASQLNYKSVDKPEIYEWVEKFFSKTKITGQISFDFIYTENDQLRVIECNPRAHSAITMFYNHPKLVEAYLHRKTKQEPLVPLSSSRPVYWFYNELIKLKNSKSINDVMQFLSCICRGVDGHFSIYDPLPFFFLPHFQITILLFKKLIFFQDWMKIDFNIGKLIEPTQ